MHSAWTHCRISQLGIWSSQFGLELLAVDKWELRRDLTGLVLSASSAHDPPYVDIDQVDPDKLPPGYKVMDSPLWLNGVRPTLKLND